MGAAPAKGGCDALALTCAAAVTIAGQACINEVFAADTDFKANVLWIFPVSGSAHTEVTVSGCMGYAAGGIIGMTNNFPSHVEWTIQVTGHEAPPYDWVAPTVGDAVNDWCVTPFGFGQYCADAASLTVASEVPLCMTATAQVRVAGNLVSHSMDVPGVGGFFLGTAAAHASSETSPCDDSPPCAQTSTYTQLMSDKISEDATGSIKEALVEAWKLDAAAQFQSMASSGQAGELIETVQNYILDEIPNWVHPEAALFYVCR